jgi:signal transduction histidine kinase
MRDFLKNVALFNDLPEADFVRVCDMIQDVEVKAGEVLFEEGSEGDHAYVIGEGQLDIIKVAMGREILLAVRGPGEIIGEMSLLERAPRMATVRARTDSQLMAVSQQQFDELVNSSVTAARTMLNTVLQRWRANESLLRQSDKMAQLGTLTAGVAHEMNNPAAAVKRGSDQLLITLTDFEAAQAELYRLVLSEFQQARIESLAQQVRERATHLPELDALVRSDREADLEPWLESQGIANAWEHAPILVNLDYSLDELAALVQEFSDEQTPVVIDWLCRIFTTHSLLTEIGQGAEQISEIVKALKSYAYLDRGPVQSVDVHEGLNNTLLILRSKLRAGISVRREYDPDLPAIEARGSELNQVWTNLIDNAVDALEGQEQGEITLRTRHDDQWVVVEVEDNGCGIADEVKSRIFDPFFTTKPQGQGTGLGLDISYNIVVFKHQGDIRVDSQPGKTRFQVWLPIVTKLGE